MKRLNLLADKRQVFLSVLVTITFMVTFFVPKFYAYIIFGKDEFNALSQYYKVAICHGTNLILCFLVAFYIAEFSFKKMFDMLGMSNGIFMAFALALLSALPQLLGMQYLHGFNYDASFADFWFMGVHPGYYEEIVFRGFLIGMLVRFAKWPEMIPLVLSSLFFGIGHLYQANNMNESIAIFLTAFGAGAGFYLFYKYSNWNLWFPLFLHSFMDISTTISNYHGNITMGFQDNIFRVTTILCAIFISYRLKKKAKIESI